MDAILYNNLSAIPNVYEAYRLQKAREEGTRIFAENYNQNIAAIQKLPEDQKGVALQKLIQKIHTNNLNINQIQRDKINDVDTGNFAQTIITKAAERKRLGMGDLFNPVGDDDYDYDEEIVADQTAIIEELSDNDKPAAPAAKSSFVIDDDRKVDVRNDEIPYGTQFNFSGMSSFGFHDNKFKGDKPYLQFTHQEINDLYNAYFTGNLSTYNSVIISAIKAARIRAGQVGAKVKQYLTNANMKNHYRPRMNEMLKPIIAPKATGSLCD